VYLFGYKYTNYLGYGKGLMFGLLRSALHFPVLSTLPFMNNILSLTGPNLNNQPLVDFDGYSPCSPTPFRMFFVCFSIRPCCWSRCSCCGRLFDRKGGFPTVTLQENPSKKKNLLLVQSLDFSLQRFDLDLLLLYGFDQERCQLGVIQGLVFHGQGGFTSRRTNLF
jgi:hypothetical protein